MGSEGPENLESALARIAELEARLAEAKEDEGETSAASDSPASKPAPTRVDHAKLVISGPVFGLNVKGVAEDELLSRRELLAAYLNRVVDGTRAARIQIIDPDAEPPGLADIFIRLEVHDFVLEEETADDPEDRPAAEFLDASREGSEGIPASAFIAKHPRAAITGKPGSGKTSLADMLALCLAGELAQLPKIGAGLLGGDEAWPAELRGEEAPLPILVPLREFAAARLTAGEADLTLWQFIENRLGDGLAGFGPHLRTHLVRHGGIALLDGLDEVPEVHHCRELIKNAVAGFAHDFGKVRIVLTSRTYAYRQQDWAVPGFQVTELLPLTEDQWNPFVEDWYASRPQFESDPDGARARAALLKDRIAARPQLRELAERPLLLTLIAHLDARHSGQLPDDREELYDEAVRLLLDTWEKSKRVLRQDPETGEWTSVVIAESAAEFLQADRGRIERALESLAYEAHAQQGHLPGPAGITETILLGKLAGVAGRALNTELLQEYVRDRAGILTNDAHEIYSFPHRSFQEYLAARHLNHQEARDIAKLLREDPERWREVFLLCGARLLRNASDKFWTLCRKLCPEGGNPPKGRTADSHWLAAALTGQLLSETGAEPGDEDEKATRGSAISWLVSILEHAALEPADRALAGAALGWLGDPRPGVAQFDGDGIPVIDWVRIEPAKGKPFDIARYPVTVAQFGAFTEAGGYHDRRWWRTKGAWDWREESQTEGPGEFSAALPPPNHPRTGVSWFEARAFCAWLGHHSGGRKISLPGDREWLAATHVDDHDYPWGEWDAESHKTRSNMRETKVGATTAVGSFAKGSSPEGVHDLSGNVWEWQNESVSDGKLRVLRGGAFLNDRDYVRSAIRGNNLPITRYRLIGFRVMSSPSSSSP